MSNLSFFIFAFAASLLVLTIYFWPALVADRRHHHNRTSIWVVNIFLGWTFIGWVVALAMAYSKVRKS
jgi:hypothetical protein